MCLCDATWVRSCGSRWSCEECGATPRGAVAAGRSFSVRGTHRASLVQIAQCPSLLPLCACCCCWCAGTDATLGAASYVEAYWAAVVTAVGAHTVVPCHWDDFSIPLSATPRAMPGMDVAMAAVRRMAERDGVQVVFQAIFDTLEIDQRRVKSRTPPPPGSGR